MLIFLLNWPYAMACFELISVLFSPLSISNEEYTPVFSAYQPWARRKGTSIASYSDYLAKNYVIR